MNELYLAHHGILGMKWGIRRYQNKDGTLTNAGKRRLTQGKDNQVNVDNKGKVSPEDYDKAYSRIHQEVANDYQNISQIAGQGSQIARTSGNLVDRSINRARKIAASKMNVSQMTDKDLRQAINRMNLERSYKSLSTEQVGFGRRFASDLLQASGDALAIGSSIAGIMLAMHQLKK